MAPGLALHACAQCSKPATAACKGCKGMPDGARRGKVEVNYCGVACQKEHWPIHKVDCKAAQVRRALYRVGDLAKAMYIMFHKVTWKMPMGNLFNSGRSWIVYPPPNYTGKSHMVPFPSEVFPEECDKEAILSWGNCNSALDHMHNLLKLLLKDVCIEVEEIVHTPKNTRLRIMQAFNNGHVDATEYSHTVVRATLKSGEQYVLDMTGAQYRWPETVAPWDYYRDIRINEIKQGLSFGGTVTYCKQTFERLGGTREWMYKVDTQFATGLDEVVLAWQKMNMPLNTMLKLPEEEFMVKQKAFVEFVEDLLQEYKALNERDGAYDIKGEITLGAIEHLASGREFIALKGKEATEKIFGWASS